MDIARERSLPTPFANSPLLPLLLLSLYKQRHSPTITTDFLKEYDYIIVGAGSAGSVVAGRLSEIPCAKVLLLEAGKTSPLLSNVPALAGAILEPDMNWNFYSTPQQFSGSSLHNNQIPLISAKTIGGGSVINGQLYVRGNQKNYDDWAKLGADNWNYEKVLPYFKKMEDNKNMFFVDRDYHGKYGPITVEMPRYNTKFKNYLGNAGKELGYKFMDANGKSQIGFWKFQTTTRRGQRCSAAKGYLVPADGRPNLHIVDKAFVTKAVGVTFDHGGRRHVVGARREVIVSCGAINTPALLMLSGVGPKAHLDELKIPLVKDLPVGSNFQDHVGYSESFESTKKSTVISKKLQKKENIYRYINKGRGVLTSIGGMSYVSFLSSKHDQKYPDFELMITKINTSPTKQVYLNLKQEVYDAVYKRFETNPTFLCAVSHMHPESRGYVRLNSSNPYDLPIINPKYYEKQQDVDDVVAGLKTCIKIAKTRSMRKAGVKLPNRTYPHCEHLVNNTDKFLGCKVRSEPRTFSHYVGTAKMGSPFDPTAVVDPELRVIGIKGLRVADASVMPLVTYGNTNVPTMMIGERAADFIKQTIECPEH